MTKPILCFAIVIVNIIHLNAQITLSTQAEVDAWDQSITVLNSDLTITGDNTINLNTLSNLTTINGTLLIDRARNLDDISGFRNLTTINGSLIIQYNFALSDFNSLSNLETIRDKLQIGLNVSEITSINGFSNLRNVGEIELWGSTLLTNIDGFNSLTYVPGDVTIRGRQITDLKGFSNLQVVGGLLTIDGLLSLQSLNGLCSLESAGSIRIWSNSSLTDCCCIRSHLENTSVSLMNNATGCQYKNQILDYDCGLKVNYETNPPCIGLNNGEIKLYSLNYDTIPFNYSVTDINQQLVATGTSFSDIICIEGLAEGSYSAYVTQPNGEEFTLDNIILDPLASPSLDIAEVATISSFNGLPNGSINLDYSGGSAPYTISLTGPVSDQVNTGATSAQFDNLPSGNYILIVQDSDGVTRSIELKIVDETLLAEECSDPMDIIVLNLVSSSISADEYAKSKPYFQTFFESLNLGSSANDSQIAVAEWAGKNEQNLRIPITGDLSQISLYQDQSRSFTGGTDPLFALKFGYEYLLANGRPNAQKVIIFTFDGCPGFSAAAYCEELKENGVIIADIGIDYVSRSSSYQNILRKAATRSELAYFAPNFNAPDPLELYVDLTFTNCSGTTSNIYFDRDGSITLDNVSANNCPYPEFVEVTFTVASMEQLSIPIGMPVSFYHNDPTAYGAGLISTFLIPCPIPAGKSESFTISLPIETATHLFAVLNDDGLTSPAFSLPNTDIQESLYSNNIDDERICVDGFATLQALKSSVSLYPLCEDIVLYNIDVCNISLLDAFGVMIEDESPASFSLVETIVNTNNCSTNINGSYDIPAGCCVSLTLSYNVTSAAPGYYRNQDVFLSGPAGQTYLDFDGATTSAEDILLDGTEDCGTPVVTFQKDVNYSTTCVDHSLTYTFTIDNQSSNPLFGVQFTDVLPAPLEWVYKPYDKQGLSINIDDFQEGQTASFTIDQIDAETIATFVIDVYVGYTDLEVTAHNTARISGFPDYINNGVDFLESNTTTTTILGDIEIISVDTITVNANENVITLNTQVTPVSTIEWTSSGDGAFSDNSVTDPTYTLGSEDRLDTLIGLFIGVDTHCGQKGKSVFIKRECSLQFDPVNVLEVCENQTLDAALSWSGGIGPYEIDEISGVIDMSTSIGLSELEAGTYNYTLNDAMGCESEVQLIINSVNGPQTTYSATEEHCDKGDGSLTLEISSGIGPYTIVGNQTWTDINDQLVLSDLSAGDYNFTITDAHGCSSEEIFSVQLLAAPEVRESVTQPDCDEMEGSVILEWTGIIGNYDIDGDFSAQDISSPFTMDQLSIGSYQITVSDAFSCEDEIAFEIMESLSPEASASTTCIDSTMYSVQISTGNFDIVTDLGLAAINVGQDAYEINNIPTDETIIITVTDPANGCDKLITIDPPDCSCSAIAEVGGNQEISCYQESVILDGSASSQGSDYSYAWYDSDGNLLSTENQYETDQEGTYRFEITDLVNNCAVIKEVMVTDIRNIPEASIISSTQLLTCENELIELSVDPEPDVQYVWQHLVTGEENIGAEIMVDQAGQVQLSVQDTLTGCSDNDILKIEIDTAAPSIILLEPQLLNCEKTSVNIDASGSDQGDFVWLDSDFQQLAESTQVLNTGDPGIFYYQLENGINGCVSMDSVIVTSNYAIPALELADEISLNCNEEEVSILPKVISDHEFELEWAIDQQMISTDLNLLASEPGTYFLVIEDKVSACESRDTIEVLPANEIQTVVISQSDIICHGEHSGVIEIMNVEGGTPDYSYYLNQQPIEELKIEELFSGDYNIRVVDTADCDYDTLITLMEPMAILSGPDLNEQIVTLGRDVEVNIETNLAQEDIAMVIWMPTIDCDNCLAHTFENVQEDLNYQITIVDKNNCEESLDLRILVNSDIAIYLPNVINPNTDNNGFFFPQTSVVNDNVLVKEMIIYDRWGNLVFVNNNFPVNSPAYGWDGSFNSGQAEIGVYVYTIVLENGSEIIELSGDVTLLK